MKQPFVILFAGPVGSSKTPLAHMLSTACRLPIFNNDAVRVQTSTEHQSTIDVTSEYIDTRNAQLKDLLTDQISFIYDASIDRHWNTLSSWLDEYHYTYFIISIDISATLITEHKQTEQSELVAQTLADHASFLRAHAEKVNLHITDHTFQDRFTLIRNAVSDWISSL